MKKILTSMAIMLALVLAAYGCGMGGEASYSPDPTVEELVGGEDGGAADGDGAIDTADSAAEERDCFLDGFCHRQCTTAADCPGGFSCILNVCTFDCQSDAECGTGGVCSDVGLCEALAGEGMPACTSDTECSEERFCNEAGECERIPILLGCQNDADCPPDHYCDEAHTCEFFPEGGIACSADTDCPGNYHCDALGECTQECRSHYQCLAGEACSDVGACVTVGSPAWLVSFTFGALGSETDPGTVSFESARYRLIGVQITPAGRNQALASTNFKLTGSFNY